MTNRMTADELADRAERLIGRKMAHIEHAIYSQLPRDYRSGWREGLMSLRDDLVELIRDAEVVGIEEAARSVV